MYRTKREREEEKRREGLGETVKAPTDEDKQTSRERDRETD